MLPTFSVTFPDDLFVTYVSPYEGYYVPPTFWIDVPKERGTLIENVLDNKIMFLVKFNWFCNSCFLYTFCGIDGWDLLYSKYDG